MFTKYFCSYVISENQWVKREEKYLLRRKFKIPFIAYDEGVSPGWTLAEINTTYLLFENF